MTFLSRIEQLLLCVCPSFLLEYVPYPNSQAFPLIVNKILDETGCPQSSQRQEMYLLLLATNLKIYQRLYLLLLRFKIFQDVIRLVLPNS